MARGVGVRGGFRCVLVGTSVVHSWANCDGLENHLAYQEAMKAEATVACSTLVFDGLSMNASALRMVESLRAKDVEVKKMHASPTSRSPLVMEVWDCRRIV